MSEADWWRQRVQRLTEIRERVEEIMDRARTIREFTTEPVKVRFRQRVGEVLDRVILRPPPLQALKCPSCGASIPKDAKFCPSCGVGLTQARPGASKPYKSRLSVEV